MKKALALTLCVLTVFALFMCSCQKVPERVIISSGGAMFSYSTDPDNIDNVLSSSDMIVYGTIEQVRDGTYNYIDGSPCTVPCFINTIKVEKVIAGDVEKGESLDFLWGSGYVSYPLYLEKENVPEKMRTGELYEQNKDNPNAFMEIVYDRFPIMEKGDKYLIFLKDFPTGACANNSARFVGGKVEGGTMFEGGLTYDQVIEQVNAAMERAEQS